MEPRLSEKPLPLERQIAVGFGYAALERDGVPVWSEDECDDDGSPITVAQAESMAALDPEPVFYAAAMAKAGGNDE